MVKQQNSSAPPPPQPTNEDLLRTPMHDSKITYAVQ